VSKVGGTVPTALANTVADAMNKNQPNEDKPATPTCVKNQNCINGSQLKNTKLADGEIQYTTAGLKVTAPQNYVDFGFANILGIPGATVHGTATVNIYSPGLRVLPMFAVLGCDYGLQTLADPANGHDMPVVPPLAFGTAPSAPTGDTNVTKLVYPPTLFDSGNNPVNSLTLNSIGNKITVTASKWSDSRWIGFFRGDDTSPTKIEKVAVPGSPYTKNPSTALTVAVPDAVAKVETIWYVRVYDSTGGEDPLANPHSPGKWSAESEALPIRVGKAYLQCAQGSSDGNFGTLRLPRTSPSMPSSWLPVNIANGLQTPLSLTKHQEWATDSPPGKCFDGVNNAVTSPGSLGTLNPATNCVSTDTGLAANDATQGFVTGSNGYPGLLTTKTTPNKCDPNGGSADRTVNVTGPGGGTFKIINSVLTCYFTNTTTSIADIATDSYNKGAVLDMSILDDPRFVWVPVVAVKPDCGTCSNYSIIDVRPGFLTDQQPWTTAVKNASAAQTGVTSDNGITIANNGITSLKVVFFNLDAMSRDVNDQVIDYLGVGPKIVRMID
jgi:hypothetical protein